MSRACRILLALTGFIGCLGFTGFIGSLGYTRGFIGSRVQDTKPIPKPYKP